MESRWNLGTNKVTTETPSKPIEVERFCPNDSQYQAILESSHGLHYSSSELTESDDLISEPEYLKPPEHACEYCLISKPSTVVQCFTCQKWFCNHQKDHSNSHIVEHLIQSQHNQVIFHPSHNLITTALSCYKCGCRNIFNLGFAPSDCNDLKLICNQPCDSNVKPQAPLPGSSQWQPLIWDRAFLSWLIEIPDKKLLARARKVTANKINTLEGLWKKNPLATYSDLESQPDTKIISSTRLKYDDAHHYKSIFEPLLKIEAEYEKDAKESKIFENLTVRWVKGLNGKLRAYFDFPFSNQKELAVTLDEEMSLKYTGDYHPPWEGVGRIIKLPSYYEMEIGIELPDTIDVPSDFTEDFTAGLVWNSIKYDRMYYALKAFVYNDNSVSNDIYLKLMGHDFSPAPLYMEIPHWIAVPNLPQLNSSQTSAIKAVLKRPFSLIQGPPGTGKTVTSATIVYHLVKLSKEKVLVCAPSNIAVDHLAEKIHSTGLKVVRVVAKSRESRVSSIEHLTLHHQIKHYNNDKYQHLVRLKQEQDGLTKKDEEKLTYLMRMLERKILREADVVMCTCVGAGDLRLNRMEFKTVLIDEVTQATEPECLIPLTKGCRQAILVGDHQQLGPVVMSNEACKAGLNNSLFERLLNLSAFHVRLHIQYRMHPSIAKFPSDTFYEGSLQNGVTAQQRILKEIPFPWPNPNIPQFFLSSVGPEENSASGTSFLNRTEAKHCEAIVTHLLSNGAKPDQIGIITPYEGQRSYLNSYMESCGELGPDVYKKIDLASVDAFQGREKDFIIVSCVRSNSDRGIGFLRDPRRLNVSITRARYGLILIGNPFTLSKDALWRKFLLAFQHQRLLVEGNINQLLPCSIDLTANSTDLYSKSTSNSVYDEFLEFKRSQTRESKNTCTSNAKINSPVPSFSNMESTIRHHLPVHNSPPVSSNPARNDTPLETSLPDLEVSCQKPVELDEDRVTTASPNQEDCIIL